MKSSQSKPRALSETDVKAFYESGYHGPIRAITEDAARRYRTRLEKFEQRWPDEVNKLDQGASLLCPWIDEFIRHPGIVDPIEDVLGPDLLVWGVSLRLKEPDGKTYAGWHQDTAYCDVKPIVVIAALALSDCSAEAGCLRLIPSSHKWDLLPHREHFGTASLLSREQQIDATFDTSGVVEVPLKAGEIVIFNNAICHSSGPNRTHDRRMIFLIEYVPTHAYQHDPRESAMLVRGEDNFDNFDSDPRPKAEMGPSEIQAWRRKIEIQASVLYRGAEHRPRALQSASKDGV